MRDPSVLPDEPFFGPKAALDALGRSIAPGDTVVYSTQRAKLKVAKVEELTRRGPFVVVRLDHGGWLPGPACAVIPPVDPEPVVQSDTNPPKEIPDE